MVGRYAEGGGGGVGGGGLSHSDTWKKRTERDGEMEKKHSDKAPPRIPYRPITLA